MSRRRVLLTHYDLDGVSSSILINKMVQPIEKRICCGYGKVKDKIEGGDMSGFDSCIVTDISLDPDQFERLSSEYDDKFMYIDHHPTSREALVDYSGNAKIHFTTTYSATAIIFQTYRKFLNRHKDIAKFVVAVDAYDMWRHQKHPDMFKLGYDLNTLFWKYGFDDFEDRFLNNFSTDFSIEERMWIAEHKIARDIAIKKADITKFGNNSVLIFDADQQYVNDFALQLTEYDVFYIAYVSKQGKMRISIRSLLDGDIVNIGQITKEFEGTNVNIISAGGHPQSGGVDLQDGVDVDTIIDIVENINDRVEAAKWASTDVPF